MSTSKRYPPEVQERAVRKYSPSVGRQLPSLRRAQGAGIVEPGTDPGGALYGRAPDAFVGATRRGAQPLVGSVGDSYDNALAETIIGLLKTEIIHRRGPWHNLEAVEYAMLEWVDWFNHRRLLEPSATFRQQNSRRRIINQ
jgi:putative transposase